MRLVALALAAVVACTGACVFARDTSGPRPQQSTHQASSSHSKPAPWFRRDSHGKIARDPRELNAFKKQHPCPATGKTYGSCPGYTVDHVIPLKRGGADAPYNMQWQTNEAAKQKDKWE